MLAQTFYWLSDRTSLMDSPVFHTTKQLVPDNRTAIISHTAVVRVVYMFQISGDSHTNFRNCACNICKTAKNQLFQRDEHYNQIYKSTRNLGLPTYIMISLIDVKVSFVSINAQKMFNLAFIKQKWCSNEKCAPLKPNFYFLCQFFEIPLQ